MVKITNIRFGIYKDFEHTDVLIIKRDNYVDVFIRQDTLSKYNTKVKLFGEKICEMWGNCITQGQTYYQTLYSLFGFRLMTIKDKEFNDVVEIVEKTFNIIESDKKFKQIKLTKWLVTI